MCDAPIRYNIWSSMHNKGISSCASVRPRLRLRHSTESGKARGRTRTPARPAASCFQSAAISEVIDVSANREVFLHNRPTATGYKSSSMLIRV